MPLPLIPIGIAVAISCLVVKKKKKPKKEKYTPEFKTDTIESLVQETEEKIAAPQGDYTTSIVDDFPELAALTTSPTLATDDQVDAAIAVFESYARMDERF